jgi:hypothetical protein
MSESDPGDFRREPELPLGIAPSPEPVQPRKPLEDTDPRLLTILTSAGNEWGALGVALVAASLTDRDVLIRQLSDPPGGESESLTPAREEITKANDDWKRGAAYERERTEALIIQAQDYAHAESERADKLATLARDILSAIAVGHAGDAPVFTQWQVILDQLEGAAGAMSPPESDPLEAAYQEGIRAHRERILRGARQAVVSYSRPGLGNGPEHGQHVKVVPWVVLEELLGEEKWQ